MKSTKNMAIKKRKGSSKLENLGIPEEELYRQQQELFAKVCNIYILYIYYIYNIYILYMYILFNKSTPYIKYYKAGYYFTK